MTQKGRVCIVCEAAYAEQDSDMCNRCSVDMMLAQREKDEEMVSRSHNR